MSMIPSEVLWQKNLFNIRYNVQPLDNIQCQKSAFHRLADMTEKSNKRRKKFPWLLVAFLLALVTFYTYDGNALVDQNAKIGAYASHTPHKISDAQYLPMPQNIEFPQSYNVKIEKVELNASLK